MPTPILEALLDSVTAQVHQLCCVDISREQWARSWFVRHGLDPDVPCNNEDPSTYDLVICSTDQLDQANKIVVAGGLILSHGNAAKQGSERQDYSTLQQTAKIHSEAAVWTLFTATVKARFEVAIVLIACDQGPTLRNYLEVFAQNETDVTWQLVVVDMGSSDFTPQLLEAVEGDISSLRIPAHTPAGQALQQGLSLVDSRITLLVSLSVAPDSSWLDTINAAAKNFPDSNVFLGQLEVVNSNQPLEIPSMPPVLFAIRMTPDLQQIDFSRHATVQQTLGAIIQRYGAPRVLPSLFGQILLQTTSSDPPTDTRTG